MTEGVSSVHRKPEADCSSPNITLDISRCGASNHPAGIHQFMASNDSRSCPNDTAGGAFAQTHWSMVLAAADAEASQSFQALEHLCRAYWPPLYAYLRRRGYTAHDAQDLTQEFLARLMKNRSFAGADPQKGRFRTYLLGALNHFLSDESDKAHAQKRGGGEPVFSLDEAVIEERQFAQQSNSLSPEKLFDRRWALSLLEQALRRLREESIAAGRGPQFESLKAYLTADAEPGGYDAVAATLNMSANHVAVAVHRLRERYRELVRKVVADTVTTAGEAEDELHAIFS
jgi:RNA polymerase sigma factor (sigma-70 family)